jgi:hypothetical protein
MKKSECNFDDQALGIFVDGLQDAAHSEQIIKAMKDDPEIRERVYQLRRAKDLMELGFCDANAPPGKSVKNKSVAGNFFHRIKTELNSMWNPLKQLGLDIAIPHTLQSG